ncbi:hypothetical protein D3C75_806280 [compost metagenome]
MIVTPLGAVVVPTVIVAVCEASVRPEATVISFAATFSPSVVKDCAAPPSTVTVNGAPLDPKTITNVNEGPLKRTWKVDPGTTDFLALIP